MEERGVQSFEDLEAWRVARQVVHAVYALSREPGLARDCGLCGQVQRAAVSIMSNVAEGFERVHLQEKLQFYNVARGSTLPQTTLHPLLTSQPHCVRRSYAPAHCSRA